jgi:hypothetical protein
LRAKDSLIIEAGKIQEKKLKSIDNLLMSEIRKLIILHPAIKLKSK